MTKRVAYFDYAVKEDDNINFLTPNKKYDVIEEDEGTFKIYDDAGVCLYCLKGVTDCAHLMWKTTWILEDI